MESSLCLTSAGPSLVDLWRHINVLILSLPIISTLTTSDVISSDFPPHQPSITQYGRNATSQNEMASLTESDLSLVDLFGQTKTFKFWRQKLLYMSLVYKCGSVPGAHFPASLSQFQLHSSLSNSLTAIVFSKHGVYYHITKPWLQRFGERFGFRLDHLSVYRH